MSSIYIPIATLNQVLRLAGIEAEQLTLSFEAEPESGAIYLIAIGEALSARVELCVHQDDLVRDVRLVLDAAHSMVRLPLTERG